MSYFTDIFIKRPVLSTVLSLFIFIFGLRAITALQLRQYPKMENTVITVTTAYPGASANLMQGFVTTPIEKAVASADGVDYFTSESVEGVSTVTIYVKLNYDPNKAFTDVMSKVEQIKNQLPQSAQTPIITKKTGSSVALMYMSFSSKVMTPEQITAYVSQVVQPKLETLDGVSEAEILGPQNYAMRIWLNPNKMAAYGVTPQDISTKLQQNNFQSATGNIKGKYIVVSVNAKTGLQTAAAFKNMVIKKGKNGSLVRLGAVARVQLGSESYDSSVYFNGKKAIFIAINATPTANPISVIDNVYKIMPSIQQAFPSGLHSNIVYDSTKAIKASIDEVTETIFEASLIVIFVIFLFLGNLRAVIIPVVTLPLSMVGVFGLMLLLGYSINLLTLLALVLAIGLVVDDAIVVVENTHRHIEAGMLPYEAAIKGAREIVMPIVSMTITLAAVYVPIGFMQGVTGALFTEFAFTLAAAVILSGVIALTLSPMMCSRLLLPEGKQNRMELAIEHAFDSVKNAYQLLLEKVLRRPRLISIFAVFILVSCGLLYQGAPKQLAPTEDLGVVFSIITAPKYANIDYLQQYSAQLEKYYDTFPSKDTSFVINGWPSVNGGMSIMVLKPWSDRKVSQADVYAKLSKMMKNNAGLFVMPIQLPALPTGGGGPPLQFVLTTLGSYSHLYHVMQNIVHSAQSSGKFIFVSGSLRFNKPVVNLNIDRNRAAMLDIDMQSLGGNLATALSGGYVNRFSIENRSFKVIPQLDRSYRTNAHQLSDIYLKNMQGDMVPLNNFASISYQAAPNSLTRFNQLNSAIIQGVPLPGTTLIDAIDYMQSLAKKTLPSDVQYDFSGTSRQAVQEGNALMYAFIFSIIVIFLVLAAQFESFSSPLIVMITVPMAICGALLPLNWGGRLPLATVNIYTQIGLITLIGLISKHGILMVEFADKLREQSAISRADAILQAAMIRLRPVLMTTAAMVFGVVPLLIASGAGAVSRFDIGLTIASGMSIGTLFTLMVLPVMYTFKPSRIISIFLYAVIIFFPVYYWLFVM